MTFDHKLEPTPGHPDWKGFTSPNKLIKKDTWAFYCYSYYDFSYGPCWAFNHWETQKYDEGLLNGSEKALNYFYKKLTGEDPNYNSGFYATFTTIPFEGTETTFTLKSTGEDPDCPDATFYEDGESGETWWLCPYLKDLFGDAPDTIYCKMTINKTEA
jgi:hypothetical protein